MSSEINRKLAAMVAVAKKAGMDYDDALSAVRDNVHLQQVPATMTQIRKVARKVYGPASDRPMKVPIVVTFGQVTSGEIDTMLTASAESGNQTADAILGQRSSAGEFMLTIEQAVYLAANLHGDADRVAQACGQAAGRAFDRAGDKVDALIKRETGDGKTYEVTVNSVEVQRNGWVEAGVHHNAMFAQSYPGVRGCPSGRSIISTERAISDLLTRTYAESGLSLQRSQIVVKGGK
jgi:hypothetical protein